MGLTSEDKNNIIQEMKSLKKEKSDDDVILYKEIIKKRLIEFEKPLLYALHNVELERRNADISDYYGVNIRPALIIPEVQSTPLNYICYKVEFDEIPDNNRMMRYTSITFTIICEQKNLIDIKTGIPRHDMLESILRTAFNWSNVFGGQCRLVTVKEGITDSDYVTRTLIFEVTDLNGIRNNNMVYNNRF